MKKKLKWHSKSYLRPFAGSIRNVCHLIWSKLTREIGIFVWNPSELGVFAAARILICRFMDETKAARIYYLWGSEARCAFHHFSLFAISMVFCMQPSIVRSYKIGSIETENIDPHKSALTATRSFTQSYVQKGKWGKRHPVMTLLQFLSKRERVVHTQTSNLICNCAAAEQQHTKKCEWGRLCTFL